MIQRGKYQSLTMVNWNGFFARTFDIDSLVTTLSGGNGAGKSTTMAAFITSLIPDQTLLHFRNTTEAGSSSSSADKGLHGKLKPGACYAALEVINSRNQRLLFAVRLQQVAGRDKKVDIKPFIIQGLPSHVKPTDVLIENISDSQVRIRQINEVKEAVTQYDTAHFKAFNSVTEYHAQMFDLGALPKKLRSQSDRSKFYRLIEASLYGGISSAITKSLRDYLLPQNGGVKKAFQDMEVALRENRMTMEAIKLTQRDRDLFKHLISEATNYVASDYMRHANERRKKLELALKYRGEVMGSRLQLDDKRHSAGVMADELEGLTDNQSHLEQDHQAASDHLQLVQTAVRQQEKVERYQDDLEELAERLEEQMMVVEEATEQLTVAEEQVTHAEEEVDSLKTQLADYQQALDVQQTRALQYQQAVQALEKARALTNNSALSQDNAAAQLQETKAEEESLTSSVLSLKHRLDLSSAAVEQFDKGLALVRRVAGEVSREEAGSKARELVATHREFTMLASNAEQLKAQHRDLERQVRSLKQAQELADSFKRSHAVDVRSEADIEAEQENLDARLEQIEETLSGKQDKSRELQRNEKDIVANIQALESRAPAWIHANEALEKLSEQTETELYDSRSVLDTMQSVSAQEREVTVERDRLSAEKSALEAEIERLGQPGGSDDARLKSLADTLGGTLLSEIYDDITLDDAPYFSALYGPARHAIVVPDLKGIKEKLVDIDDCPDDLYVIEGEADGFDDSVFDSDELEGAVCVHLNDRQLRYSRFPKVPLFGRAAREHRLDSLREKREELVESYAKASFDAQKLHRLTHSFNAFVSTHLHVAFEPDPEAALKKAHEKRSQLQRELTKTTEERKQLESQLRSVKEGISQLHKLQPMVGLLEDDTLSDRLEEVTARLAQADDARHFVREHGKALTALEGLVSTLDRDPEQFDALKADYQHADSKLQGLKKQVFALADLVERLNHFAYADAVELLNQSSELSEQLKKKLEDAERVRTRARDDVKQVRQQTNQYNQLLITLKTSHQAKQETITEFKRELAELGVRADADAEERARLRRDELMMQLQQSRSARVNWKRD